MEALIKELDIEKSVFLLGWRDDLPVIYSALDILAFPTLKEAFGRAAVEAMACGVPVVASAVGGVPEIVEDGRTGFLVTPRNYEKIADALLKLMKNTKMSREMGKNGMSKVKKKFDISKNIRLLENIYNSLLE